MPSFLIRTQAGWEWPVDEEGAPDPYVHNKAREVDEIVDNSTPDT